MLKLDNSKRFGEYYFKRVLDFKNKFAFTLAEVLITLGIIGVVAALTIPTLISKAEEYTLVKQLRVAHSIFSQAAKSAINEEGDAENWDIGERNTPEGSLKLYNFLKPHLQLSEDCGLNEGCFSKTTYKALFNNKWAWQPATHPYYARGRLTNGMSFAIWSAGSGCATSCGAIIVDINGDKKPNQAGVDYFQFSMRPTGVVGADTIINSSQYGDICKYNDTQETNGETCTAWVLQMGNMDYRRRDVTNDWKRFKGAE